MSGLSSFAWPLSGARHGFISSLVIITYAAQLKESLESSWSHEGMQLRSSFLRSEKPGSFDVEQAQLTGLSEDAQELVDSMRAFEDGLQSQSSGGHKVVVLDHNGQGHTTQRSSTHNSAVDSNRADVDLDTQEFVLMDDANASSNASGNASGNTTGTATGNASAAPPPATVTTTVTATTVTVTVTVTVIEDDEGEEEVAPPTTTTTVTADERPDYQQTQTDEKSTDHTNTTHSEHSTEWDSSNSTFTNKTTVVDETNPSNEEGFRDADATPTVRPMKFY
jgi:hypothetical protein